MTSGGQIDLEHYRAMRDERDELAERVRELEALLFGTDWQPADWGLTPTQKRFLNLLALRSIVTTDQLGSMLPRAAESDDPRKVVGVHMVLLRGKLRQVGISVRSQRLAGYWLDEPSRTLCAQLRKAAA